MTQNKRKQQKLTSGILDIKASTCGTSGFENVFEILP